MISVATYVCNLHHGTIIYIYTKYHYLHMYVTYITISVPTHACNLYQYLHHDIRIYLCT